MSYYNVYKNIESEKAVGWRGGGSMALNDLTHEKRVCLLKMEFNYCGGGVLWLPANLLAILVAQRMSMIVG